MRRIRTSTDQLRGTRPAIADRLAKIDKKLEILSTSILQTAIHLNSEGDEFGPILKEQRLALEDRDALVWHIRGIPGFENFLRAPRFHTLRAAAAKGPVIILTIADGVPIFSYSFITHLRLSSQPPMGSMSARTS